MKASMKNPLTLAFAALLACQTPCPTPTPTAAPSAHVLAFPGPFPGNAAQGSLPYYGDAGFPVVLPVGLAGQPLFSGGAGANPYFGPGGNFLAISGVTTAPPTVAGGGWAVVHTTGSPAIADAPYGVEIIPAGTFPTGFGYVRACAGSPSCSATMSVEVGATIINNGDSGSFTQFMFWGPEMEENATGKYVTCELLQAMTSVNEIGTYAIDLNVNGSATQVFNSILNSYSQPFIRLRLDGAGHVVCEVSVDRNRWVSTSASIITVASAFTTGPDHVGIGSNASNAAATTYISVFDFVSQ